MRALPAAFSLAEPMNITSRRLDFRGIAKVETVLLSLFSARLSCAAEMRALPAAFSLAEPMNITSRRLDFRGIAKFNLVMDPGNQMPTASYTFGKDANSYSDWDW
ncbi:unnamed protein product [Porites evermanni]|uniref:Uncharacterized protein n=1 Tax=Porites evermanni TaxID=104178 RepID=A0ABN8MP27_9CNID|nr:unnamed protein product [Porites evermanni]